MIGHGRGFAPLHDLPWSGRSAAVVSHEMGNTYRAQGRLPFTMVKDFNCLTKSPYQLGWRAFGETVEILSLAFASYSQAISHLPMCYRCHETVQQRDDPTLKSKTYNYQNCESVRFLFPDFYLCEQPCPFQPSGESWHSNLIFVTRSPSP